MAPRNAKIRLSAYFFLQYFMLGVWFVALGTYMSKTLAFDGIIGLAYAAQGLAALLATPFVGALADRLIPARKLLALLMAISAATLFWLSRVTESQELFLLLVLVHFLAFVPTIALSNAVCLNALADPDREFARIRVMGTVGWIAGGILVGAIPHALLTPLPILFAATAGVILALVSLLLPDLPAAGRGERMTLAAVLGLDAVGQMRDRSFWAVCLCAALLSIPLAFYNAYCNNFLQEAGASVTILGKTFEPTAIQALGQVSELSFLLLLPFALRLVGIGGVLVIGMLGWIARATLFAVGFSGSDDPVAGPLVVGILLHGVCYDFILIGAALYVDQAIRASARSRAQSFLTMITMGAGVLVGSIVANAVYEAATVDSTTHDWALFWSTAGGIALFALVLFLTLFRGWSTRKAAEA